MIAVHSFEQMGFLHPTLMYYYEVEHFEKIADERLCGAGYITGLLSFGAVCTIALVIVLLPMLVGAIGGTKLFEEQVRIVKAVVGEVGRLASYERR